MAIRRNSGCGHFTAAWRWRGRSGQVSRRSVLCSVQCEVCSVQCVQLRREMATVAAMCWAYTNKASLWDLQLLVNLMLSQGWNSGRAFYIFSMRSSSADQLLSAQDGWEAAGGVADPLRLENGGGLIKLYSRHFSDIYYPADLDERLAGRRQDFTRHTKSSQWSPEKL